MMPQNEKFYRLLTTPVFFRQIEEEGGLGLNINHLRSAEWLGSAE
ncbi:hypothetical protein N8615_01735 [Verrucomicrobiales bacterium]|nr:hypothetical protein [Verrucomicrobiales bacterium]